MAIQPANAKTIATRHISRAEKLNLAGKLSAAVAEYQKALRYNPYNVRAIINWGLLEQSRGNFPKAHVLYHRAIEIAPDYALAYFNMGNCLVDMDYCPEALMHYLVALDLNPRFAHAHYNVALLYQSRDMLKLALKHMLAFVHCAPPADKEMLKGARQEIARTRWLMKTGSKAPAPTIPLPPPDSEEIQDKPMQLTLPF